MRHEIATCFLIGDNSLSFNEICKSLRFSSHCKYIILSPATPFNLHNLEFMDWENINTYDFNHLFNHNKLLYLTCYSDHLSYGIAKNKSELHEIIKYTHHNKYVKSKKCTKYLKKNFDVVKKELIEIFRNYKDTCHYLNVLIDFQGNCKFLSATGVYKTENHQLVKNKIHIELQSLFENVKVKEINTFLSVKINKNLIQTFKVNTFQNNWMLSRSIGINIPLILIQNLLNRKIKTFYFLKPSHILNNNNHIRYKFDFRFVYFDLDETLVWNNKPLKQLINLLIAFHNFKHPIILITRHKFNISDTLQKIGIDKSFFEKIIKVNINQKKSSFIKDNSLFFDNEFPERLDVHLNCDIPALDLDQIDFIVDR